MTRVLLAKLCLSLVIITKQYGNAYKHLGCYHDDNTDRDLDGKEINYGSLLLETCVSECRADGYPYAGLQTGSRCFCGNAFGKHGLAANSECNYTCGVTCGGPLHNNVYYTVKIDSASVALRELVVYSDVKTFLGARQTCILADGDLASITNATVLNDTVTEAQNNGLGSTLWFGLRRRIPASGFEWTDETLTPYAGADYVDYWKDTAIFSQACVSLDLAAGKWDTVSCVLSYPFACIQDPTILATVAGVPTIPVVTTPAEEETDSARLALFIVLPIMFFCYGGSCMAFCCSKLCKSIRMQKQRQKKPLRSVDDIEGPPPEYEPGNRGKKKPLPSHEKIKGPPPEYEPETKPASTAMSIAKQDKHASGKDVSTEKGNREAPKGNTQSRTLRKGRLNVKKQKQAGGDRNVDQDTHSQTVTPPTSARPATTQAIDLDLNNVADSPIPGSCQPLSTRSIGSVAIDINENETAEQNEPNRAGKRRGKLLQNALKQVRGRKNKRTVTPENTDETALDNVGTESEIAKSEEKRPRHKSWKDKKKEKAAEVHSNTVSPNTNDHNTIDQSETNFGSYEQDNLNHNYQNQRKKKRQRHREGDVTDSTEKLMDGFKNEVPVLDHRNDNDDGDDGPSLVAISELVTAKRLAGKARRKPRIQNA